MPSFLLLFWAPKNLLAKPRSPDQARESGEKWHSWAQALDAAGHSVTGAQLQPGGLCVTQNRGRRHLRQRSCDGGYFVLSASSLAEATELAKGCPVLQNGGTVEVRPINGR